MYLFIVTVSDRFIYSFAQFLTSLSIHLHRTKMRSNRQNMSNDGFLLNLVTVLSMLFEKLTTSTGDIPVYTNVRVNAV